MIHFNVIFERNSDVLPYNILDKLNLNNAIGLMVENSSFDEDG